MSTWLGSELLEAQEIILRMKGQRKWHGVMPVKDASRCGDVRSHRFQPWEMLKIWSNTQDWTVVLDTEGQTFSHRAWPGGFIRWKGQEQGDPCLHGPLGWASAAATPQLPFSLCNWNSHFKQMSRALTHTYKNTNVQSHCLNCSWWDG